MAELEADLSDKALTIQQSEERRRAQQEQLAQKHARELTATASHRLKQSTQRGPSDFFSGARLPHTDARRTPAARALRKKATKRQDKKHAEKLTPEPTTQSVPYRHQR